MEEIINLNSLEMFFYHDEKYAYLTKVFDSKDHGISYHVKIFKIDYNKVKNYL